MQGRPGASRQSSGAGALCAAGAFHADWYPWPCMLLAVPLALCSTVALVCGMVLHEVQLLLLSGLMNLRNNEQSSFRAQHSAHHPYHGAQGTL